MAMAKGMQGMKSLGGMKGTQPKISSIEAIRSKKINAHNQNPGFKKGK